MAYVLDRVIEDRASATFAPTQIGRTRYKTPEGYLLAEGVRVARTGAMLYTNAEMKGAVSPNPSGAMVTILRDADVLFSTEAMLSFNGKSVTNDHPAKMITPATFRDADVGVGMNVRRGEGVDADYLVADLLIKDAKAIADALAGKVEISLGYDAEIEELAPGLGRQTKITGNHFALVKRGRAGSACAIQDSEQPKETVMTARNMWDRLTAAFKANDETAFNEAMASAKTDLTTGSAGAVIINVGDAKPPAAEGGNRAPTMDAAVDARFKTIEDGLKTIGASVAKLVETKDAEAEAAKAKALADEAAAKAKADEEEKAAKEDKDCDKKDVTDAASKAEILAPGIKLPAMDKAVKVSTVDALRREALTVAVADAAKKPHLDKVLGGRTVDFKAMDAETVAVVFDAAAALISDANNHKAHVRVADIPAGAMTTAKYAEQIKARRGKK